tara:strand:- start:365 stop:484 length:120 start_codon:yes stop_codon:yes gene_type:complete
VVTINVNAQTVSMKIVNAMDLKSVFASLKTYLVVVASKK